MSFTFRPAVRSDVRLVIGIAGPSGGGKTLSALKVAAGLAGGKKFAVIDTEAGRALHYAHRFDFLHAKLDEPFSPERYREILADAAALNPPVIVVDSMSHEHDGIGGVLWMHDRELDERAGDDVKKRKALNQSAWIKPKRERKLLRDALLRVDAHLILCFRAEEKTETVPDPKRPGKMIVVPKKTIVGHVGWIPVGGKEYPYELTLSLVVTPDRPGVPTLIKEMDELKPLVDTGAPLDEETGRRLGEWARGSEGEVDRRAGAAGPVRSDSPPDRTPAPSLVPPMTAAEFKAWRADFRIPNTQVAEHARRLFPGVNSLNQLTDPQRGQLRAALADALTEAVALTLEPSGSAQGDFPEGF